MIFSKLKTMVVLCAYLRYGHNRKRIVSLHLVKFQPYSHSLGEKLIFTFSGVYKYVQDIIAKC